MRLAIALGELGVERAPEWTLNEGLQAARTGDAVAALWALLTLRSAWPKYPRGSLDEIFVDRFSNQNLAGFPVLEESPRLEDSTELSQVVPKLKPLLEDFPSYHEALSLLDTCPQDESLSGDGQLPLLGSLPRETLATLLTQLQISRRSTGDCIVEEGELGGGVFYLLEGRAEVFRRSLGGGELLHLTALQPGALIGEMALFTEAPRVATVTCREPCWLIELPEQYFATLSAHQEMLTETLSGLVGQRMLSNLKKSAPVLQGLSDKESQSLLRLLEVYPVQAGQLLIERGVPSPGVFLIMDGLVQIERDAERSTAWLREGELFGGLSEHPPAMGTCRAMRRGLLLYLSRERFLELRMTYPVLEALYHYSLDPQTLNSYYTLA
ncbi:MAG: cyclic nucleotide-binding domain-containing protein [Myxococcota bacterium]|nr:cyclic nucleotide-binding domain-containing protein [Myxococcota bacterium]